MSKLCFKYEYLQRNVIPKLNNNITELEFIKEKLNNVYIPSDFQYYSYLSNINDTINEWIQVYSNTLNKIESMNYQLNNNMNYIDSMISSIEDISYKI